MKTFKIQLDPQHQISPILLENLQVTLLGPTFNDTNTHLLVNFNKACRLVEDIGWEEHTSDWDPYFKIGLINGQELYSESGYWDLEITGETDDKGDQVRIQNFDWDEDLDKEVQKDIILSVNEISYIKIMR